MARRKREFIFQALISFTTNSSCPILYSQDPFAKKELYTIKAPSMFAVRNAGKTIVNRTAGQSKFLNQIIYSLNEKLIV